MSPFERAEYPDNFRNVDAFMRSFKVDRETAVKMMRTELARELFINDTYQVSRSPAFKPPGDWDWPLMVHLSIKRLDKEVIRDWRELQTIKNMLVGPENDAMEIYPAESRLVDMANQFHIWAFVDPKVRIPTGWMTRMVCDEVHASSVGAKQRPHTNLDTMSADQLKSL
jgi:hypothetical protein